VAVGLSEIRQDDFSAGEFRAVARHLIPPNGAYSIRNGLLDEEGLIYRRGGASYESDSGHGSGLTFVWAGMVGGVDVTLIASDSSFATVASDGSVTDVAGGGLAGPAGAVQVGGTVFIDGGKTFNGTIVGTATQVADVYAATADRLIAMKDSTVYLAAPGDPTTFPTDDNIVVADSYKTIAGRVLGNRLLWFTERGMWAVNNLELDVTDALGNEQIGAQLVSSDLVAWGNAGIAMWRGALVVPALDGVWLVDGVSAPRLLSRSIAPMYREFVTEGMAPGIAAVHRDHYFLPVLSGAAPQKMLVCRLDRPVQTRVGEVFPWTHFGNEASLLSGLAVRRDGSMVGAEGGSSARLVRTEFFDPEVRAVDQDGSPASFAVTFRDFTSPAQDTAMLFEARYQMDSGSLTASYSTAAPRASATVWGAFNWGDANWSSLGGDDSLTACAQVAPPAPTGSVPFRWRFPLRSRVLRYKLESTGALGAVKLWGIRVLKRASGGQL
jgi:hypothetical protein